MEPEKFITFIESLKESSPTNAPQSRMYFRAIYIGYQYPNLRPPSDDNVAREGYKFGLALREQYHEKFK